MAFKIKAKFAGDDVHEDIQSISEFTTESSTDTMTYATRQEAHRAAVDMNLEDYILEEVS